jgi:excisionase family DNA binding protein
LETQKDTLLTVKQIATYLSINQRTVLKLVGEGTLPGVKIGNQWRFRKSTIETWLDDQMIGKAHLPAEPPQLEGPQSHLLDLASCFQPEHIVAELSVATKTGIIEELVILAHELALIRDKTWFMGALIERENVMPSAIGNGVAFLHTLHRNPDQIVRPFVVLGRSTAGADFDSFDGKPTHLFFVLGLKHNELHLPWLQKLSKLLIHREHVAAILAAPDAKAIFRVMAVAEQDQSPIAGTSTL